MQASHGDCLDCLTDEMCQMNTQIGCIPLHQSRLGCFVPSLERDSSNASLASGDDDDVSDLPSNDKLTTSQ